jgi:hypothetical protein
MDFLNSPEIGPKSLDKLSLSPYNVHIYEQLVQINEQKGMELALGLVPMVLAP